MQIFRQVLRHPLGQRRDQHAFMPLGHAVALADQVVDLPLDGSNENLGVEQAGRADDLLGNLTGTLALKLARRRGNVDCLSDLAFKLREGQRAVVKGARQTEAVIDKALLTAAVAGVHRTDLRQRHMALVHEQQKVLGEIVQQRHRRRPGCTTGDHARIILDPAAKADLLQHLDVIHRPLADTLRLQQLVVLLEPPLALLHLPLDLKDRAVQLFA